MATKTHADADNPQDMIEMEFAEAFPEAKKVSRSVHDNKSGHYETVNVTLPIDNDNGISMVASHQTPDGYEFDQLSVHPDTDGMMFTAIKWLDGSDGD